jgi:hypothetical protein
MARVLPGAQSLVTQVEKQEIERCEEQPSLVSRQAKPGLSEEERDKCPF